MAKKFFAIITNEETGKSGQGIIEPKISITTLQMHLATRNITLEFTELDTPQHVDAVGELAEEGNRL